MLCGELTFKKSAKNEDDLIGQILPGGCCWAQMCDVLLRESEGKLTLPHVADLMGVSVQFPGENTPFVLCVGDSCARLHTLPF